MKHAIGDHQLDRSGRHRAARLGGAGSCQSVVIFLPEEFCEHVAHRPVVLNNQDARHRADLLPGADVAKQAGQTR
jgi:hypothetical protein